MLTLRRALPLLGLGLLLTTTIACGGSTEAPVPSPTPFAVTGFEPGTVASEIPTDFTVTGKGFEPVGEPVEIRLIAEVGTPFCGGTESTIEFGAEILSETLLEGTTDACGVVGTADARVAVVLPDDETATSASAIAHIEGPTLTDLYPEKVTALLPRMFGEGERLGPAGSEVGVRLDAHDFAAFEGGTSMTTEIQGWLEYEDEFQAEIGFDIGVREVAADVTLLCDSGAALMAPLSLKVRPGYRVQPEGLIQGDHFGSAVALASDYLIVGAPQDDDMGNNAGAVYVYKWESGAWTYDQKVYASTPSPDDFFGGVLAVSGNTFVVGCLGDDDRGTSSGAVYVFVREAGGWVQQAKLIAADTVARDMFGSAVALDGEVLVTSATLDDDDGENSGSVYVFRRDGDTWIQEQKLRPDDGGAQKRFGERLALSGARLVVGVWRDDTYGTSSGAVYAFERQGGVWAQTQKLFSSEPAENECFGDAIDIHGQWMIVGAYGNGVGGFKSGAAYLFEHDGWEWGAPQRMKADDVVEGQEFGREVAIGEDILLISTYADDTLFENSGILFVYERDGKDWQERGERTSPEPAEGQRFGDALDVFGDMGVVGVPSYDEDETHYDMGVVFVY